MLSEFALRFVQSPLHRGPLEGATHSGESNTPGEGPYVQIWLIVKGDVIQQAAFKSPGCPSSTACGGVLCALITGRSLEAALKLEMKDLLALVGELPEGKGHYAERAIKALSKIRMPDRTEWLLEVDRKAKALLAEADYASRFDSFLRPDQIGKWGLDNLSGYYWYLHALVSVTHPKKVLELGRCLGTSALFMLGALDENSTLITVDTNERASDLAHVKEDPRLKILVGNDLDLQTYKGIDLTGIDFLFIDTDHTNEQATKEWNLYLPFLSANALVAFDDITMNDMGIFWSGLECPTLETGGTYHYTGFGLAAP